MEITVPEGTIKPPLPLAGHDGNAFAILGRAKKALQAAGNDDSIIESYWEQATSGSYEHLLAVTLMFTADAVPDRCECGSEEIEEDSGECNWCGEVVR